MPSTFWRFASVVTLTALIASDPAFNGLWNAQAACVAPSSNTSTLTTRITTFTYDVEGRLSQVNSPEGYINYDYDLITGRHVGTCTQNSETTYEYDALGRLWKVHAIKRNGATINETTEYEYTEVGSRKSVTLPSSVGIKTSYAYDDLNRLSGLTNRASDNSILSQFNYQVDATGRRTNATEILKIPADEGGGWQTNTMSWAFDGMYRLTNEVCVSTVSGASYTNSYQYDLNGNRWQKTRKVGAATETVKSYYNANDQLLREEITPLSGSLNTNYYAYDANGSLTAKTNATSSSSAPTLYTYDLKNKMSSVAAYNGSTWTTNKFEYNEQGIRVRTITGSIAKHYLVDANNHTGYAQVLEEFDVSGGSQTLSMSYVLGDDVLAQRVSSASYLLYDGHGSTRQTASNTGSVASRYNYDAYGVALTGTSTTPAQTDFLYCGEQFDSTLKMYNQRARFYDPANGRFNARDTFMGSGADPQSLHKYAYANCDPVNGIDPSGKMTLIDISSAMTLMVGLTMHELRGANAALKGAQALFGGDDVTVGITYGLDVIEAIDNAVAVATLAVGLAYGGYKLISWIGSGSGKLIKNLRRIEWKDSFDPTRYPNPRGWLPPYKPGTKPREFTTNGSIEFKRVIVVRDGGYKKQGPWVVRADEIAGKSPVEIKNHIGLDDVPSYIQDVVIPPQVKMRVGYAADQPAFNSTGGGVQYEILQDEPPASWFSEPVGL